MRELEDVVVEEADAALATAGAYLLGEAGAVDADAAMGRGLEAEEERAVGTLADTLAVLEVVSPRGGVLHLNDRKGAFRGAAVADLLLVARVLADGDRDIEEGVSLGVCDDVEAGILLRDDDVVARLLCALLGSVLSLREAVDAAECREDAREDRS